MPIPFRPIARLLSRMAHPAPRVDLSALEPLLPTLGLEGQGVLFTINHFTAPGFPAWWQAIHISAVIPAEIHWVVTSGWTNSGWLDGITHWLFPRGARLLGFTPMPAMPPNPAETAQRVAAVRAVLKYAKSATQPVIGLAPEGGDTPGGVLGTLPPGVGRFMFHISRNCPLFVPVGIWSENGIYHLKFGQPYQLDNQAVLPADELDRLVARTVMHNIAVLLPDRMRGIFV